MGAMERSEAGVRYRARKVRAICLVETVVCLMAIGLALAPAAGATPGEPMRLTLNKVRLQDGRLLAKRLPAVARRAHAAIVGGSPVSIAQAPWQVLVLAVLSETDGILCGGAILNDSEVLTAGHCVYNPETRQRIPADQVVVAAGTSDLELSEPEEQATLASAVRVHPYYVYNPTALQPNPDDVAVLELKNSLAFGSAVRPISLTPADSLFQEGTSVNLTGFGEENPLTEELTGELHSIGMTLDSGRACGGEDDALFLCASTSNGSDCFGDSGSGLTLAGTPTMLIGVTDTVEVVEGKPCLDGAVGGFANVAAPEVRDFIVENNPDPPLAPRGGGASIRGVAVVGYSLTCEPGVWSNGPIFNYVFINSANGQTLQQGSSSTYPLTAADLGRTILCQVLATTAGGTGVGRTGALQAVRSNAREEEEAVKAKVLEESAAAAQKHQEEATATEAAAAQKHEEEAAAQAATNKRAAEEAAKQGVLASKETAPDATIASTSLQASASGAVSLKISCPAGESSCAGTVTLHTLNAVSASVVDAWNAKAAVLTLATGSFSVPGGQVKTITLHLSTKARKLLARDHLLRVRATVIAHNPAGGTHTTQSTATLRPHEAGHGKG